MMQSSLSPITSFLFRLPRPTRGLLAITAFAAFLPSAHAQVSVVTQHNDNARTGQNLNETLLNTSNVSVSKFGKLFTRSVDGEIMGQPLYLSNVAIPSKGVHNVVYVATMHNKAYAFDADNPALSAPLWQVTLGPTVDSSLLGANDASTQSYPAVAGWHTGPGGTYGVQSTPVIDPSTGTIYICAMQTIAGAAQYVLHGLNVATGAEKFGGPVTVTGSVAGTGEQSVNGIVSFHADRQLQRPGLLLANGKVYIGFGGHADMEPLHGWVIAYNAGVLGAGTTPAAVYCSTPNGARGAIWQSGQGISSDASGNVYVGTGDGTFDGNTGGPDRGDSIVQLTPTLTMTKSFTPFNQNLMAWYQDSSNNWQGDLDLGSSCVQLIPGANLAFQGSKDGKIYEVDLNALTWGYNASADSEILDSFQAGTSTFNLQAAQQVHSMVYWNGPVGPYVYVWPDSHTLQAYQLSGSTLVHPTSHVGPDSGGGFADLALSANGSSPGTGILWAVTGDPALRAYDATNVATSLWNSNQNSGRDGLPSQSKWSTPTVANGKVYVATVDGELDVYGVLAPYPPTSLRTAGGGGVVSLSWNSSLGNTSYNVKRSTASGGPYSLISAGITDYDAGPPGSPRLIGTYMDHDLVNGTTYYYEVTAVNSFGEGAPTLPVSGTPTALPTTEASIVNTTTPITIDGIPNEAVWASAPSYPCRNVFLEVPSSPADCSGYFKVAWDSSYFYILFVVTDDVLINDSTNPWDDDDTELYIDTTNSRASAYGPQDFEYSFPWNDTGIWEQHGQIAGVTHAWANTATGYVVEAKIPWTTLGMTPSVNAVIGLDAAIAEDDDGGNRDARLSWIDNNNDDWHMPSVFGTGRFLAIPPPVPTGLTAAAGNAQVSLGWNAISGASGYNVKRGTVSGGPYTTVASPVTNSYTDTGLTNGTTYYYVVSATNPAESANSSQVSARPLAPPVLTSIAVSPSPAFTVTGSTVQFTAVGNDQYGTPMSPQPTITWSVNGGGSINAGTGLFTAGSTVGGPFSVSAYSGSVYGYAQVYISRAVPIIDFNGDGKQDLVLQNTANNQVALWYLNGATVTGGAYLTATPPSGWSVVGIGDFNGDGKPDVAMQNSVGNKVALWYLNGTAVTGGAYVSVTPPAGWSVIGVGDFNGDGKPDLALQNTSTRQVAFWYMSGATVTGGAYLSSTPTPGWMAVSVGDFNGDGKPDLVMQNTTSHKVSFLYLNGPIIMGSADLATTPPAGWNVAANGDYNHDGKLDLVLQDSASHKVAFWYLNGTTVTGGQYLSITPPATWTAAGPD